MLKIKIVPTQLLGYADGGMSQGWSTLYALELLNKDLLIAGTVINEPGMGAAFGVDTISTTAA